MTKISFSAEALGGSVHQAAATGVGVVSTLGVLGLVPLLIGGYVDEDHLSLRQASALISVEVAAGILVLLVVGARMKPASRSALAGVGATLAGFAYIATAMLSSFWPLCGCRVASGIGIGLIGAAVNTSVAQSPTPERLYATGLMIYGALGTILFLFLPALYQTFGYWTLFIAMSVLFFVTAALSSGLRVAAFTPQIVSPTYGETRIWVATPGAVSLTLGYLLMWIAFSMIWAFAERKAAAIGMTPEAAGFALAMSNIVGLLGSMLANRLSLRIGRSMPIAAGGLILTLSFLVIGFGAVPWTFVTGFIGFGVGYFFLLPYVLGLAAALDPEGGVSVRNSIMPMAAHLVSPLLGATALILGSFPVMSTLSAATMVVAIVLVLSTSKFNVPLTPNRKAANV